MNERNTKKILFNNSTLLSLKAELLKKQEEVIEKKQLPQHKLENFKPALAKQSDDANQNENRNKKTLKDSFKNIDIEELEACKKAKAVLEKKAELYEHLSDKAGNSQLGTHFLVDFSTKKQNESTINKTSVEAEDENNGDDSEWTEFTDCLGRTRKCLRVDLELFKEKDKALSKTMTNSRMNSEMTEDDAADHTRNQTEKPFLVQKTNDFLQSLREKWEQKEQELLSKDKDIHYQDLLYDEARMHGVSYYSFSTDESERRKQMEALIKQREETLQSQREAEEIRKKREELIAARVAATRARQRARAGLPPEEPQDQNQKDFNTCLLEFLQNQKDDADNKAKEEEQKIREEIERERQKLRESYVREWDIGKDGVPGEVKRFKELTQEEYVEQQRAKRLDEFAPPQAHSKSKSIYGFDDKGNKYKDVNEPGPSKSWADVRPEQEEMEAPLPLIIGDYAQKGLFFSSKKETIKSQFHSKTENVKYKNFVKSQEPSPIINELAVGDCEYNNDRQGNSLPIHAAVAPPMTYDYYGPVPKQRKIQKSFESDIQEAYEQGANSLKMKGRNLNLSKDYDFTFD